MAFLYNRVLRRDNLYVFIHQCAFLITGISITLGTQWIFYHGAATGDSYLTQLAQYFGMVLVGALIPLLKKNKTAYNKIAQQEDEIRMNDMLHVNVEDTEQEHSHEGHISHRAVIKLAFMDVFANFCVTVGFSIIGSGMYQVIYSSVVIWCAVLTFLFMNRKLSILQWIAIFGTSAGLAMSSLDSMKGSDDASEEVKNGLLMFGTLMTLSGTFFYSCVYVYSDYILSKQTPPPLPARVCFYSGIYTSLLSLGWIGIYTLPRFDKLIHIQGTNTSTVLLMYIIVSVSNAVHSWNYYELIDRTGSVATGILQGLRAVLIYVISNSLYCQSDASQCFTVYKGLGSTLVIGSVLLFTISRR